MNIRFRFANANDSDLYFNWANDELVRKNSFNQAAISYNDHVVWFNEKVKSPFCYLYLFLNEFEVPIGQVRIDKHKEETVIGISIDLNFRGMSLAKHMLNKATEDYLIRFPEETIVAYIKKDNAASLKGFKNAGFTDQLITGTNESLRLVKSR